MLELLSSILSFCGWTALKLLVWYWFLGTIASTLSCLVDISWGLEWKYLSLLEYLFNWAMTFCTVHEEENVEESHSISASRSLTRLHKRENLETLKMKLNESEDERSLRNDVEQQKSEGGNGDCLQLGVMVCDAMEFVTAGMEVIVEDDLSASFTVEELPYWNLMARNKGLFTEMKWKLKLVWCLGLLLRYVFLLPVRTMLMIVGLLFLSVTTILVSLLPASRFRSRLGNHVTILTFRLLSRSLSLHAVFHNKENAYRGNGIAVANHTSVIDVIVLNTEIAYCLTGQRAGGMVGFAQKALTRVIPHLFFDRSTRKDRNRVLEALKEHSGNPEHPPLLVFPEGVCVNNTSTVMFKKGCFEATDVIYPIAIRYNAKYGDAFWSQDTYAEHLLEMLSSWAIVCDVYYLPPAKREDEESAADFAERVKAQISTKAGLQHIEWDGLLHQWAVLKPEHLNAQKVGYSKRLKRYSCTCLGSERSGALLSMSSSSTSLSSTDKDIIDEAIAAEQKKQNTKSQSKNNGNGELDKEVSSLQKWSNCIDRGVQTSDDRTPSSETDISRPSSLDKVVQTSSNPASDSLLNGGT